MEDIIIRYLTDSITNEELTLLHNWLQSSKNKEQFNEIIKINQNLDYIYSSINTATAYQNVKKFTNKKKYPIIRSILKNAAIWLIFVSLSIGLYFIIKKDRNTPLINQITLKLEDGSFKVLKENGYNEIYNNLGQIIATVEDGTLSYKKENLTPSKLTYNELTIPYGKQLKLEMLDGTIVFINSGSKLKYPISFLSAKNREVFLDGESYFNVKKNKASPFIVHTKNMNISVLGTKFNVSSYNNEDGSTLVLEEGSVKVSKPLEDFKNSKGLIISSGQQVVVKHKIFNVTTVDVEQCLVWTKGQLAFKNDRFEDIIKKLERYYNVNIENNSSQLNNIRYTGTFTTETISEVLNIFKESVQFEYKIEANKIVITSDIH